MRSSTVVSAFVTFLFLRNFTSSAPLSFGFKLQFLPACCLADRLEGSSRVPSKFSGSSDTDNVLNTDSVLGGFSILAVQFLPTVVIVWSNCSLVQEQ